MLPLVKSPCTQCNSHMYHFQKITSLLIIIISHGEMMKRMKLSLLKANVDFVGNIIDTER